MKWARTSLSISNIDHLQVISFVLSFSVEFRNGKKMGCQVCRQYKKPLRFRQIQAECIAIKLKGISQITCSLFARFETRLILVWDQANIGIRV